MKKLHFALLAAIFGIGFQGLNAMENTPQKLNSHAHNKQILYKVESMQRIMRVLKDNHLLHPTECEQLEKYNIEDLYDHLMQNKTPRSAKNAKIMLSPRSKLHFMSTDDMKGMVQAVRAFLNEKAEKVEHITVNKLYEDPAVLADHEDNVAEDIEDYSVDPMDELDFKDLQIGEMRDSRSSSTSSRDDAIMESPKKKLQSPKQSPKKRKKSGVQFSQPQNIVLKPYKSPERVKKQVKAVASSQVAQNVARSLFQEATPLYKPRHKTTVDVGYDDTLDIACGEHDLEPLKFVFDKIKNHVDCKDKIDYIIEKQLCYTFYNALCDAKFDLNYLATWLKNSESMDATTQQVVAERVELLSAFIVRFHKNYLKYINK